MSSLEDRLGKHLRHWHDNGFYMRTAFAVELSDVATDLHNGLGQSLCDTLDESLNNDLLRSLQLDGFSITGPRRRFQRGPLTWDWSRHG